MDVNKTHSITPVGSGVSPWQGTEAFAIEGLLAGDLDPKVSQALERMASQIEPLRAEVELARGRESHFKEISEQHSFLPLSGRREFFLELTHILSHMEGLNAPVLIVLHLVNGDDISQRLGRGALDGALIHVAEIIESTMHPTDAAGNLGGNDFALVLLAGDLELAGNRAQRLVDAITSKPFLWLSEAVTLRIVTGIALLDGNMTPETALNSADRNLFQALSAPNQSAKDSEADQQDGQDGRSGDDA